MSQPPRHMSSRDFRSQASLRPTYVQIGSDDPSVIEEAQNLLARFMRPSHEAQGSQNESRATSHNGSKLRTENRAGTVDDYQALYAISDDSAPKRMLDKHAVPTIQQHTVRHPHLKISQRTTGLEDLFKDTVNGSGIDTELPTAKKKQSNLRIGSQTRQTPYPPSLLSDGRSSTGNTVKGPGIRRSARSRNGPANYYEKLGRFGFESEDEPWDNKGVDTTDSSGQSQQDHHCARSCDFSAPPCYQDDQLFEQMRDFIIYSSPTVQILKAPFRTLDDFKNVTHACYRPERNPANYAKGLRMEDLVADKILHFDFDQKEMTAVLKLLSFSSGCQWSSASDIPFTDQLIQAVSTCNMHPTFFNNISSIFKLSKLLSTEEISDSNASLLKLLTSNPDTKELQRAKRLAVRLLRSQEQRSSERFSASGDQRCEGMQRLSAYLPFASALGRRQCADIEAFIADAKNGSLPSVPSVVKAIKSEGSNSTSRRADQASRNLNRLLQDRELGCVVSKDVSSHTLNNLRLSKTWKGASNDVIVLAWSPDGTRFVAGAAAQCDEHNLEYNRGNNLILGDLTTSGLEELPDHFLPYYSRVSGRVVNDHRLFMSVTACQWFEDTLYTASYDNTVKLWEFPYHKATCYKTLSHSSKVQVMARSNFDKNVLATGTQSVGYWEIKEENYNPLNLPRQRSKREIDLIPTSLAWGTISMTKELLIAGMSEKGDGVPHNGLLAAWRFNEASAIPLMLTPNSQNIFDIKWHPCLPLFATASSARGGGAALLSSKCTRSVVRLYSPLSSKMCTMEFECPALDINDVTFCPSNPNYVTASCTDGITYVWDQRNPDLVLHSLQHGEPLNQIDETLPREQADVGVRLALWGNSVNQFYTGASDGILKNWNILRSPDNALVEDVASFGEEIMCGAFSPDKSNLLIGDAAGGLHLLSPNACADESLSFKFKRASQLPLSECDSNSGLGVMAAHEAISTGRLVRHPIYGVGQGPHYNGPYAAWARPDNIPEHELRQTKLKEEWQLRQLDGVTPALRAGLNEQLQKEVECQRQLARIRNVQHVHKRKRADFGNLINLYSDDGKPGFWHVPAKSKRLTAEPRHTVIGNSDIEIIDLTGDSDTECTKMPKGGSAIPFSRERHVHICGFEHLLEDLKERLEDDHWWPPSDRIDPNIQDADV
ncbi:hypothetical protein BDV28DRAFT_106716 [Aspergillus coremiiformis]|uniref:WD40-repeat-containing domain protein n=1 Tax=Aspergillus coremiiformis TaxID=138285 RepID=A0A5N6YRN6_9EURO|nr:hypothetical protein BDV28DRAFT_106716 [Aspergillus coremiiformis]